jgi:hypothetical protein
MVSMGRCVVLAAAGWLAACAADDKDDTGTQSVGDASSSSSGATSEADSSSGAETSTGGEPQTCTDARLAAPAFIGANLACVEDTDCTQVSTFCLDGSTCGSSAIAVGYDVAMWTAISNGLDTCTNCGADPCGACSVCSDGICTLGLDCE